MPEADDMIDNMMWMIHSLFFTKNQFSMGLYPNLNPWLYACLTQIHLIKCTSVDLFRSVASLTLWTIKIIILLLNHTMQEACLLVYTIFQLYPQF